MRRRAGILESVLCGVTAFSMPAVAQTPAQPARTLPAPITFVASRTASRVTVNGILDEAAWAKAVNKQYIIKN
jgi:hypothetical protein